MRSVLLITITLFLLVPEYRAQSFTSSHLPIVVVNTGAGTFNDNAIPDEPKMPAFMGIIDNGPGVTNSLSDPFNHYNGNIGIETRGNSTQSFSKKSYSVELRTALDQDTSVNLFGMGKEEDWILHAMVIDKTQLRIPMSFYFAQRTGHYASDWKFVELVIDGDYRGIYLFCEKIKRDDDRVDIAKLDSDDLAGDSLTGGYILRIDWLDNPQGFASNYNAQGNVPMFYQFYYPKASNIHPTQSNYIANYIDLFESAVFSNNFTHPTTQLHYADYVDITSFVDFLIINELSKNSDGYKLSSYLYKDKDSKGGKLTAGPIWDFDQTYGLSTVCSCDDPTGWTYLQNQAGCDDLETMPMWWQAMMSDTLFTNHLACRWSELRSGPLHQDSIYTWIDQQNTFLGPAIDRNFQKWNFIGQQIWAEPQPIPTTYSGEIQAMKNWISVRLAWLDVNMPGNCQNDVVGVTTLPELEMAIYPNPTSGKLTIKAVSGTNLSVYSVDGSEVYTGRLKTDQETFDFDHLWPGIYMVILRYGNQTTTKKLVIR